MTAVEGRGLLDEFATTFISGIGHHSEIRTERLADQARDYFGLPEFPSLEDLGQLCDRLGIARGQLPAGLEMRGFNFSVEGGDSEIHLRDDLSAKLAETTLGHELREVLENAFKRVKPDYVGLDTCENRTMNPESDQFAGCLLMPEGATRARLGELGMDIVRFAAEKGRSLSSVVIRLQQIYSATRIADGPVGAFWLFEAPYELTTERSVRPADLRAKYVAKLGGFSMERSARGTSALTRLVFPVVGASGVDLQIVQQVLLTHRPQAVRVGGFDMFRENDFLALAVPVFSSRGVGRVVLAVIRCDREEIVRVWLQALDCEVAETYQVL